MPKLNVPVDLINNILIKHDKIYMKPIYIINKLGKQQIWETYVNLVDKNDNEILPIKEKYLSHRLVSNMIGRIYSTFGEVGGKLQTTSKDIEVGKNIGRSNETNVLVQAIQEMKSMWKKQIDRKGYSINPDVNKKEEKESNEKEKSKNQDKAENKSKDQDLISGVRPMLLGKYEPKRVKFPACIEIKYDGMRCLANIIKEKNKDNEDEDKIDVHLISRTGVEIMYFDHIRNDLLKIKELVKANGKLFFDGELFAKGLHFQDIISLCRKSINITDEERKEQKKIKFYVFDIINLQNPKMKFIDRKQVLKDLFEKYRGVLKYIEFVPCTMVNNDKEVQKFHESVSKEYEGSVIKLIDKPYEISKRSNNVLKLKNFEDSEFEIVDVIDGVGKEKGLAILVLKTKDGKKFKSRPQGSYEYRSEMFKKKNEIIGKMATVKFMDTTADGVPRHGVVLGVRDYE